MMVRVRPLLPQDAPYLVDIFEHMSADSRYSRFHQPLENVALERVWREAEAYCPYDARRLALLPLPICRISRMRRLVRPGMCVRGMGVAETAVSVRDDMQRQGIGSTCLYCWLKKPGSRACTKLDCHHPKRQQGDCPTCLNRLPYPYTKTAVGPESELVLDLT